MDRGEGGWRVVSFVDFNIKNLNVGFDLIF